MKENFKKKKKQMPIKVGGKLKKDERKLKSERQKRKGGSSISPLVSLSNHHFSLLNYHCPSTRQLQ